MTLLSVRGRLWLAWVVGAVVSFSAARGQGAALPASAQSVLLEMAGRAAVIFTGEVVRVDRQDAGGFVDVKFRVDQPVKGVQRNGAYVLREWAGLWVGGPERYRVGQRYLMLLTARGSSGMSGPVGGMDGAIPLTAGLDPPLFKGNGDAPVDNGTSAPEPQVDLRWLSAEAARVAPRTAAASGSTGKTGSVRPRLSGLTAVLEPEEGVSSGGVSWGEVRRPIASPILEPGDGEAAPAEAWVGAISPLPATVAGIAGVQAGTYPVATALSTVLGLLSTGIPGSGSTHAAR